MAYLYKHGLNRLCRFSTISKGLLELFLEHLPHCINTNAIKPLSNLFIALLVVGHIYCVRLGCFVQAVNNSVISWTVVLLCVSITIEYYSPMIDTSIDADSMALMQVPESYYLQLQFYQTQNYILYYGTTFSSYFSVHQLNAILFYSRVIYMKLTSFNTTAFLHSKQLYITIINNFTTTWSHPVILFRKMCILKPVCAYTDAEEIYSLGSEICC